MKYLEVENTAHYHVYWRGDPVVSEDGLSPVMFLSLQILFALILLPALIPTSTVTTYLLT